MEESDVTTDGITNNVTNTTNNVTGVTSNVTSVLSNTSETDVTNGLENATGVTDVIPRTNSNTIIHVHERIESENGKDTENGYINIDITSGVTADVIHVTSVTRTNSDNTTLSVKEQANDSQKEAEILANGLENTSENTTGRIDIDNGLCIKNNTAHNVNNNTTNTTTITEHLYKDYEHLHCQVIEVKGYSNDMVYENDENVCSASNAASSSSQKQCTCNCHLDQSHSFATTASQSNPVPSTSNSQSNLVLEQSGSQSTPENEFTTIEIGLDNASFEILRENSTISSNSVKPPTYKSLGEFYLNDEPPKYEAITGKKLADELVRQFPSLKSYYLISFVDIIIITYDGQF